MPHIETVPLHETTRTRYLNYALSVITARALPDIRDGLKPVQRRILYAMFKSLRLLPDARYRKSATIVGDVMGKYHPHGDTAIYDAMVRMAQEFSLRDPLVDGHGNFGSIDGDSPAAMRYTEARLRALAVDLLEELNQNTVDFRPNFDGALFEPVVLPAKVPNLLVNGSTGIAVGMATSIPPHNLTEVVHAACHLVNAKLAPQANWDNVQLEYLVDRFIKGPDFPTGGSVLNTREELLEIYRTGQGPIITRGEYKLEGQQTIIITSIPFAVSKGTLLEKIGDHIARDQVPQLTDVRDESTDEIRIVLELKQGASAEAAMWYLFKHTPLESRFHCNLTCLVPTEHPQVCTPEKVDLPRILRHFLRFRHSVVTRRLRNELEKLIKRIHILEGFEIVFDALDEAVKVIRTSRDRKDADQRLKHRFGLSHTQSEAVLDARLYKLAQMEIFAIRNKLDSCRARATEIQGILGSEPARWRIVQNELNEMVAQHGSPRRTTIAGPPGRAADFSKADFIVNEDTYVIVTREGWIKRQKSYADTKSIKVRGGDEVGWALGGATRRCVVLYTNYGKAYTVRLDRVPSTSGHGVPLQKLFNFSDREQVIGVISSDPRVLPEPVEGPDGKDNDPRHGYFIALTELGFILRLSLDSYAEPSMKAGRRYMRLKEEDKVIAVYPVGGHENVCVASRSGIALIFPVGEVPINKGAGKGVKAIKFPKDDRLVGAAVAGHPREGLRVVTNRGRAEIIRTTKFQLGKLGARGQIVIRNGRLSARQPEPVEASLNKA